MNGEAELAITAEGLAAHGVVGQGEAALDLQAECVTYHGYVGRLNVGLEFSASGASKHGQAASASLVLGLQADGAVLHTRYEVRGEVRESVGGVLLARSVRVYHQGTGELVGMVDAALGRFQVHCGLQPDKYVIMPVDLSADADDYAPPVICNVQSVLAQDSA